LAVTKVHAIKIPVCKWETISRKDIPENRRRCDQISVDQTASSVSSSDVDADGTTHIWVVLKSSRHWTVYAIKCRSEYISDVFLLMRSNWQHAQFLSRDMRPGLSRHINTASVECGPERFA